MGGDRSHEARDVTNCKCLSARWHPSKVARKTRNASSSRFTSRGSSHKSFCGISLSDGGRGRRRGKKVDEGEEDIFSSENVENDKRQRNRNPHVASLGCSPFVPGWNALVSISASRLCLSFTYFWQRYRLSVAKTSRRKNS